MGVKKLNDEKMICSLALFFSNKWNVPLEIYVKSMKESLISPCVPGWYYIEENHEIVAGLGIIENDFHKRKDLAPNLCAVYVKEEYRKKGYAKALLDKACSDLKSAGVPYVYLITTHTQFYEKCGFTYLEDIEENDKNMVRCYYKKLI